MTTRVTLEEFKDCAGRKLDASDWLEITQERVEDMDKTIAELRKLIEISDDNIADFKERLKHTQPHKPLALRTQLSDTEVARIAVNRHRFPGVKLERAIEAAIKGLHYETVMRAIVGGERPGGRVA